MSARDLICSDAGDHCCIPAQIVIFRWHESCRPGGYVVHLQPNIMCAGLLTDSGVFRSGDLLRHAVVDDFGTLRGVS